MGQGERTFEGIAVAPGNATAVRIELLGGFRVTVGDRIIPDDAWRLRKAAALVKLLALAPNRQLHREELLEILWPELDLASAQNNLHHVLHVARRLLEPSPGATRFLHVRADLVVLDPPGPLFVDIEAFEAAAARARRSQDPIDYRAALALYRGELLPEDRYADWAISRRTGLHTLALSLHLEMAARCTEQRDLVSAIDALQRAIGLEPSCEEAHADLMRTYARAGQRQQSLRQYAQLEQILRDELDAEPDPATRELFESILKGELPPASAPASVSPASSHPPRHTLPAMISSFVGREFEVAEIKRLLEKTRLLTLLGVGGTGKTRLAIQAAGELVSAYDDGVFFIPLSSLADPDLVPESVARALSIPEQPERSIVDVLADSLREKRTLLILDNCEHLIDACAELAETLLSACPRLQILATSREALNVGGEMTLAIPPLDLPDPDHLPAPNELLCFDAIRLFVERARSRRPAFALDAQNAQGIALICDQLDGIPLGIELAAARIPLLSVDQIASRLDDALALLTGGSRTSQPRQKTLRGALDWSYDLLSKPEQTLFRRLSIFSGGWSLESAEAMGEGLDVLELLSRLVDKSLVVAGASDGTIRYRFLEPVRQYARHRLAESGETPTLQRAHAQLFAELAVRARPELQGANQTMWLARLEREQANVHAAFEWCLSERGDLALGLQLTASLWWFWYTRGYLREARELLTRILQRTNDEATADRAETLRGAGVLASTQGDYAEAILLLKEALQLYRSLDRPRDVAHALNSLGIIATEEDDLEQAIAYHEEALALRRQIDDKYGIGISLLNIGFAVHQQGDIGRSLGLHEESLAIGREIGNESFVALSLHNLGYIAISENDIGRGTALLRESLTLYRSIGDKRRITSCLEGLATAAVREGQHERATTLYGISSALRQEIGATMYARQEADWEQSVSVLRSTLGEQGFESAWEAGKAMPLDRGIEYALGENVAVASGARREPEPDERIGAITRREGEIAELVAQGLTNRQIAARLVIAERTVDTHVGNILRKLGLESRAQVAVWITEQHVSPHGEAPTRTTRA